MEKKQPLKNKIKHVGKMKKLKKMGENLEDSTVKYGELQENSKIRTYVDWDKQRSIF